MTISQLTSLAPGLAASQAVFCKLECPYADGSIESHSDAGVNDSESQPPAADGQRSVSVKSACQRCMPLVNRSRSHLP